MHLIPACMSAGGLSILPHLKARSIARFGSDSQEQMADSR